jgi:uncharacterized repeat protein (TIGR03803 family)
MARLACCLIRAIFSNPVQRKNEVEKMKTGLLLTILLLSVIANAQTYTESILYNFNTTSPGDLPSPNGLVMDSAGNNLYGTIFRGGDELIGAVFELSPSGVETVLHNFTDTPDGSYPTASLTID